MNHDEGEFIHCLIFYLFVYLSCNSVLFEIIQIQMDSEIVFEGL